MDWKNSPENPQPDGAESTAYLAEDPAYACKNAPFETVEELRLVKGVTMDLLYGADKNRNGVLDENEQTDDLGESASRGLLDCVTVYSRQPNRRSNGASRIDVRHPKNTALDTLLQQQLGSARAKQIEDAVSPHAATIKSVLEFYLTGGVTAVEAPQLEDALTANDGDYIHGLVNVNTAPREVLLCLPGIGENYADTLVSLRQTKATDQLASVMWITEVVDRQNAVLAGPYVTTRSYQIGADVAALGKAGRALRRSWMIFDTSGNDPVVIYRSDWTHLGWPLGASLRDEIDNGSLIEKAEP
jgi:DNA uptake protein ComE-like DNA-binding protein